MAEKWEGCPVDLEDALGQIMLTMDDVSRKALAGCDPDKLNPLEPETDVNGERLED